MLVASVVRRERRGSCGDLWLSHGGEQREVKARNDLHGCVAAAKNNGFFFVGCNGGPPHVTSSWSSSRH